MRQCIYSTVQPTLRSLVLVHKKNQVPADVFSCPSHASLSVTVSVLPSSRAEAEKAKLYSRHLCVFYHLTVLRQETDRHSNFSSNFQCVLALQCDVFLILQEGRVPWV